MAYRDAFILEGDEWSAATDTGRAIAEEMIVEVRQLLDRFLDVSATKGRPVGYRATAKLGALRRLAQILSEEERQL